MKYGDKLEPRPDGLCVKCNKRESQTADGCLCRICLRGLIAEANPSPKTFNDRRGRKGERLSTATHDDHYIEEQDGDDT